MTTQGLKHLIQYIYTGRFKISTENVISLAKAAKALKMKKFEMKCWKFIHGEVDARMLEGELLGDLLRWFQFNIGKVWVLTQNVPVIFQPFENWRSTFFTKNG